MKNKLFSRRGKKAGLPPGALVYVGDTKPQSTTIVAVAYDENVIHELSTSSIAEALALREKAKYLWINIDGLQDVEVIKALGEQFQLHSLALEDMLNSEQRPKAEQFDAFLLFIMKSFTRLRRDKGSLRMADFEVEQISFVLGPNYLITVQEKVGDALESVRQRLRTPNTRLRKLGPDCLMHALVDTLVDNYFLVLEQFGEQIETLENSLVTDPRPEGLRELYNLKRFALFLRRCVWPLREALVGVERAEGTLIDRNALPFFRDVYSHLIEVIDTVETFREMLSSMLDIYLSSVSNRMNTVIKVLTIITTIFMPLSFIAGVYGMNFQYMPELGWEFGYPIALGLMASVAVLMVALFKYRRWI